MKYGKLVALSAFLPLPLSQMNFLAPTSSPFHSTLKGGVKVSYTSAASDMRSTLLLKPNVSNDFSGEGISLRIQNHITSGDGSPMFFFLNETDSDRVKAGGNTNSHYYLYSLDGTREEKTYRSGDDAVVLPASFDGYLYLPYESFTLVKDYGTGNKSFDYSSVYGLYLEVNTYYDAFSVFSLGGVEKLDGENASYLLDPSLLTDLTYSSYYAKDYNGTYINLEHESVGTGEIKTEVDYKNVALEGTLDKGLQVSFLGAESDISAQFGIVPSIRDYGDDIDAIAIRLKNNTSISTPITIGVKDRKGKTYSINKETGGNIFFRDKENTMAINAWRGWDSAVVIPSSFDGWMILPFSLFHTVTDADKNDVRSIVFNTSVYKSYDAFTNLIIGDLRRIDKKGEVEDLLTPASLDDTAFQTTYVKNVNSEYIRFERYIEETLQAEKEGDIKYLERFTHVKNNTELNSEFPVWTGGSSFTTGLVDTYDGHKGMEVDIGGVIPNNNIYGSINVFPKYYVPDWNNWADGGESKDQLAKGLTCYLKNLSRKEIIINLEFDEITKNKSGNNVTERWNIQLGSMIMYYDINTGDEFIRMAKPAIVIPVGFEGYVRMDFSQYLVPAWCTDGDLSLDLTGNMAGIYITSDCSNNEGLSFVISDIGIYYNPTQVKTFFEDNDHSIHNNMKRG